MCSNKSYFCVATTACLITSKGNLLLGRASILTLSSRGTLEAFALVFCRLLPPYGDVVHRKSYCPWKAFVCSQGRCKVKEEGLAEGVDGCLER